MNAADGADAWTAVVERLARLGDSPLADPLEGLEHLVDQTVLWLAWEVLHADPTRPMFHRHNDLVSQWGGPNADNVYRHARVQPGRRYRIRGCMHSCDEFMLAVRAGFMHRPVWGTLATLTASDAGIGPGDDFELIVGGDEPGSIELPDGAVMVSVREYYYDWSAAEPATFTIECLDPEPAPESDDATIAVRLREAIDQVERSLSYWRTYLNDNRAKRQPNAFSANTVQVGKGLPVARYEFCFWDLAPDQYLLIECDEPDARYWSAQLYMMDTFELVDPYGAITSRNHRQTVRSPDGRIRFVLGGRDPGAANWLDTGGRPSGLCTVRWFWPRSSASPAIDARVVSYDDLEAIFAGVESVTAEGRRAELAARQEHLRWRFRT